MTVNNYPQHDNFFVFTTSDNMTEANEKGQIRNIELQILSSMILFMQKKEINSLNSLNESK